MINTARVPETGNASTASARQIIRRISYRRLLLDSASRMRAADGLSHARSLGFQVVLATLPGLIFVVAVAMWTGYEPLSTVVERTLGSLAPGPTSDLFQDAMQQAEENSRGSVLAMLAGGLAALISGTMAMDQLAKGANRIYGLVNDGPPLRRLLSATFLALSVGVLFVVTFVAVAAGDTLAEILGERNVWLWLRWPLGVAAAVAAVTLVLRVAPNRRQPSLPWLAAGAAMTSALWILTSIALSGYLTASSTFGEVYGPLAGFIGLMLWAQLTGLSLLGGIAFAAQLESERPGTSGPRSDRSNIPASADLVGDTRQRQ